MISFLQYLHHRHQIGGFILVNYYINMYSILFCCYILQFIQYDPRKGTTLNETISTIKLSWLLKTTPTTK